MSNLQDILLTRVLGPAAFLLSGNQRVARGVRDSDKPHHRHLLSSSTRSLDADGGEKGRPGRRRRPYKGIDDRSGN